MTLQNINISLILLFVGCRNLTTSSDIATNKSNDNVYLNNSHDCIASAVSIVSEAYYARLRYVIQCIYHNMVKLFRLIEWRRKYNTQLAGEYLRQDLLLVSNHSTNFENKQQEVTNHVN